MEEKEKMTFPLEGASFCPNCHCEERLLDNILNQLDEEGKLSKASFPNGFAFQVPLFDAKKAQTILSPTIKIPTVYILYDICPECHTMYCVGINVIEQPAQIQFQGPPQNRSGGRSHP